MTTYEFEVAAKNAVIKYNLQNGINIPIQDIHVSWMAHVMGNKKCLLMIMGTEKSTTEYYEVTYNYMAKELYVDVYKKICHCSIAEELIDKVVKVGI